MSNHESIRGLSLGFRSMVEDFWSVKLLISFNFFKTYQEIMSIVSKWNGTAFPQGINKTILASPKASAWKGLESDIEIVRRVHGRTNLHDKNISKNFFTIFKKNSPKFFTNMNLSGQRIDGHRSAQTFIHIC